MKAFIKYILPLTIAGFFIGLSFMSCEKKDEGGTPSISYIRVTDPEKRILFSPPHTWVIL